MTGRRAWGVGLATIAHNKEVLDTWYPRPRVGERATDFPTERLLERAIRRDQRRRVHTQMVRTVIDLDAPPAGTADAYLRLHLLSWRLVQPNTINLDNIFAVLPNVVFTDHGPCLTEDFEDLRLQLRADTGDVLRVHSIDKFPRMTDYVVPEAVRIADANRVRLGAHLGRGTTVMHEGFVNFNAGTLGTAMVEGRISQGVVVGEGSDIGGGASIMGTLSGGGTERVSIGRNSLLGANAGLGISLGDNCIVEAGLYLTAGSKVNVLGPDPHVTKARTLSGQSNWLFRRNSLSGAIEAITHRHGVELNPSLHV